MTARSKAFLGTATEKSTARTTDATYPTRPNLAQIRADAEEHADCEICDGAASLLTRDIPTLLAYIEWLDKRGGA